MARSTFEDFKVMDKIGSGSYGVVFKVLRKADRMVYAMKEIDLAGMSRKEQEECIRETRVLSSLDSDFIIKYYDSFLERGKLYIITEYAGNGNLHDFIKKQKTRLNEDLIWKLFIQILMGLNHMHSRKILHRDIKTLNVFLDDGLNVKLGDMGVAKILSSNTNFAKTIVGTPYYLSPELCEDKPYNEKSDVWALGVVLYECCTQKHPFDADNQGALILKILRGKYPALTGYSPDISDLVKRCLTQNANRRPNTFKLLLLSSIRSKAEALSVPIPDSASLIAMAEKLAVKRPGSSRRQPEVEAAATAAAAAAPEQAPPASKGAPAAAAASPSLDATMPRGPPAPQAAEPEASTANGAPAAAAAAAAAATIKLAALGLGEEEHEDDEEGENPYENPYRGDDEEGGSFDEAEGAEPDEGASYDGEGSESGDEEDEEEYYEDEYEDGEEGDDWEPSVAREKHMKGALEIQKAACLDMIGADAYAQLYELLKSNQPDEGASYDGEGSESGDEEDEEEYYEDEYEDGEEGDDWEPSVAREKHMKGALEIQKAACLDMIGADAYAQLYELLKSNQVDEASMTDLSRLVFKIIPYDKSEVIQMMYKLLYLSVSDTSYDVFDLCRR
ncbi:hypothetical protein FOA52_013341 [Chlamydomonas sp. UWO 241]|nr:hypothetical protein FOA52_013341 [Chlamydomonas sp. UWO 241]